MPRHIVSLSLLFILVTSTALAQFGKISGIVIDKQSKEPLIGATVLVVGSSMGAATGTDGRYVILNVPPGTYSVRSTYVGYQDVTVSNVSIAAGLTRELNFDLSSTAIEVNPVIIIGERPLVEKSATNAIRITRAEDIQNLPIRGVQSVVSIQPGVVVQDDQIFIRGSRAGDVGFQIEGANVRNIMGGLQVGGAGTTSEGGGALVATIPEAVEEVQVQAGGYTAQYGGANAGIISTNLKTGRERYHASFQGETDNLAKQGNQFLGTYSYGYSDYVLTLSGPAISDKVRVFAAGENRFMRNYQPVFWEGANFGLMKDTGARGGDTSGTANVSWIPGNIPGNSTNRYSLNSTVLFDAKPLLVKASGLFSWQRTRANGLSADLNVPIIIPLQNIFDLSRLPQTDESNVLLNGKGTYFFTPSIFSELTVSYLDDRAKQYDPNFEDQLLLYGDSVAGAARGWKYNSYTVPPRPYDFFGFPFNRPGAVLSGFQKTRTNYLSSSLDATAQVGRHEFRVGGSYEYWTIRSYGQRASLTSTTIPQVLTAMRNDPDAARSAADLATLIRKNTFIDNYGYDEFGNPLDSGPDGPRHPKFGAFYIQDKVEFSDLIIQAGLRYDYLFLDTWSIANPNNPGINTVQYTINPSALETSAANSYLEPRLGFSFPVTDRTVFHLQYGQFVQAPPLFTAYAGRAAAVQIFTNQFYITNPLGTNIQPERTIQYEVGFTQQVADFASFDLTGFYKDIRGQIQQDYFIVNRQIATVQNYPIYTNADFATTKGFEARFTLRRVNRVQAQLNYTLSDARGTNSFPGSAAAAVNVTLGGIKPTYVTPLSFDQTHRGSVNLDYRFGVNDGGPILSQLGANLLFSFNSGHPFTIATGSGGQQGPESGAILNDFDARTRSPLEPINASTTPWEFNLDVRVDKTIPLAGVNLNIYAYVQNLLNTQNVTNVYYRTGNAYNDGFLTTPSLSSKIVSGQGGQYINLYRAINLADRQHQWTFNGTDLFSSPRQIRIGARLEL